MKTIAFMYSGLMIVLSALAINKICKNSDKIIVHKKRFKHYRFH